MENIEAEKYFAFSTVADVLTKWGKEIEWLDNGIAWDSLFGRSEIIFDPVHLPTTDGLEVAGLVKCRHLLQEGVSAAVDDRLAAECNKLMCLSAIIPKTNDDPASIVSRVSIYEGDDQAVTNLYMPMFATDAYIQPHLFETIVLQKPQRGPKYFSLSNAAINPPYNASDFEIAQEDCASQGAFASAGVDLMTVEFPWDPGAISSLFDLFDGGSVVENESRRTSLCQLTTRETHPNLGRGLLVTLQLPIGFANDEQLAAAVTKLNRIEYGCIDAVPFMGAWCIGPTHTPAFSTFLPNELCFPGLIRNLVWWMGHRAKRIHIWIEEQQT